MSAIGKGDFVECIRCAPLSARVRGKPGFRPGAVYRVAEVGDDGRGPWVNLVGMPTPDEYYGYPIALGWNAAAFKPVYRPKASIIDALKQPITADEPQVADPVAEAEANLARVRADYATWLRGPFVTLTTAAMDAAIMSDIAALTPAPERPASLDGER